MRIFPDPTCLSLPQACHSLNLAPRGNRRLGRGWSVNVARQSPDPAEPQSQLSPDPD